VKPQLAALVKEAPDGPDWLHEMKLDGYRMHAWLDADRVNILTRRGNDWTEKYPTITEAIAALPAQNAYFDRELCGVLPDGRTAFNRIQNASDTAKARWSSSCSTCCSSTVKICSLCRWSSERNGWRPCWPPHLLDCNTTITRSARDQPSTDWPANTASKASCQSAPIADTSPTDALG
jgi:ATP dependent DNA ligase domain